VLHGFRTHTTTCSALLVYVAHWYVRRTMFAQVLLVKHEIGDLGDRSLEFYSHLINVPLFTLLFDI